MSLQSTMWTGGPILLIEDEPSVIAFLRAALERRGYSVVNAGSGSDASESNVTFAWPQNPATVSSQAYSWSVVSPVSSA